MKQKTLIIVIAVAIVALVLAGITFSKTSKLSSNKQIKNTGELASLTAGADGNCTPDCAGKQCGSDGCGGICGSCAPSQTCNNGYCINQTCTPNCIEKQCGSDGCRGICGTCSSGYICSSAGNCTRNTTCTDSDGGMNIYVFGTATNGTTSGSDVCTSSAYIKEYYCSNNKVVYAAKYCSYGCANGACRSTPLFSCNDTDGGNKPLVKGTTFNLSVSKTDECLNKTSLKEYYCSIGNVKSITQTCYSGCSEGACLNNCTDSDGGRIYTVYGEVGKGTTRYKDTCKNNTLKEYYCLSNNAKSELYNCANLNKTCSTGKCQ